MKATLRRLLSRWLSEPAEPLPPPPPAGPGLRPLARVVLTTDVAGTLFAEYADHRRGERGDEEIGWALLGVRSADEALVVATLPAGAGREAGEAHVRFNSTAQAVASRVVRQHDRRIVLLGIAHTHPGSLRHPSAGDYRGDSRWVGQLRGAEGVFAIGTADGKPGPEPGQLWNLKPHAHALGDLRLTWYALAEGDRNYRPLPVEVTDGPDLARDLRPVWPILEEHADRLDRLGRQQAKVTFAPTDTPRGPALAVTVPLADDGSAVRVVLESKEVRYFLEQNGQSFAADLADPRADHGVYLLLAELAAKG